MGTVQTCTLSPRLGTEHPDLPSCKGARRGRPGNGHSVSCSTGWGHGAPAAAPLGAGQGGAHWQSSKGRASAPTGSLGYCRTDEQGNNRKMQKCKPQAASAPHTNGLEQPAACCLCSGNPLQRVQAGFTSLSGERETLGQSTELPPLGLSLLQLLARGTHRNNCAVGSNSLPHGSYSAGTRQRPTMN